MEIKDLKIKEITISKNFKITKNWCSVGAQMGVTIEIGEDDNLNEVIETGYKLIDEKCKPQLKFKGN
jgi:hypothetical protein